MGFRSKKSRLEKATDVVGGYVDSVRPHVQSTLESALESTRDFVSDTALPALSDARDKAAPVLADARDKAAPVVSDAREKAASQLADARSKAAEQLAEARGKATDQLSDVRGLADAKVAAGTAVAGQRAQAVRQLADAKVAELKGEKPKKKGTFKKIVLLGLLAGAATFAAKKLQGGGTADNWQSTYVPTPAPSTPASPVAPVTPIDDNGGASPDEALADAAEAPHPITTPDQPAEVVDLDGDDK